MKIKSIGFIALLSIITTGLSNANDLVLFQCAADVNAMNVQIVRDGNIISPLDGRRFTMVINPYPGGHGVCYGDGYDRGFICRIKWESGKWANTFQCQ